LAKQVAFALVKIGQLQIGRGVSHVARQGMLHGRVDGEHHELVHLAQLGGVVGGGGHGANFPTGHMVGFAKAGDDECACGQAHKLGCAPVLQWRIDHVFIDLVADQHHVGGGQDLLQGQHFIACPDHAAGVVRGVDQDGAGTWTDGGADAVKVGPEAARGQGYAHHAATGQLDVGHIAVVAGFEHDDFVPGVYDGQDDGQNGLRCPGGDGDFSVGVVAAAVQSFDFGGHGFAQRGHAGHGRVLVEAFAHRVAHQLGQARLTRKVRKALAEVDGFFFGGQGRHDGEDGGAHVGRLGEEGGAAGVHVKRKNKRVFRVRNR